MISLVQHNRLYFHYTSPLFQDVFCSPSKRDVCFKTLYTLQQQSAQEKSANGHKNCNVRHKSHNTREKMLGVYQCVTSFAIFSSRRAQPNNISSRSACEACLMIRLSVVVKPTYDPPVPCTGTPFFFTSC